MQNQKASTSNGSIDSRFVFHSYLRYVSSPNRHRFLKEPQNTCASLELSIVLTSIKQPQPLSKFNGNPNRFYRWGRSAPALAVLLIFRRPQRLIELGHRSACDLTVSNNELTLAPRCRPQQGHSPLRILIPQRNWSPNGVNLSEIPFFPTFPPAPPLNLSLVSSEHWD